MNEIEYDRALMKELLTLARFIDESESTITNALFVHARRQGEAAKEARAAFEAGHSDGLITNQGYRMAAELAEADAQKARDAAERLSELLGEVREAW